MSSSTIPTIPKWVEPEVTREPLEYVDLVDLDLSKFDNPVTRKELARDLLQAVTEHGFFTISNHGIPKTLWDHQMDIGNTIMHLSQEEKKPYEATSEEDAQGIYVGFKPSGELGIKGGFHKEIDHYNILLHDLARPHPPLLRPFMNEVEQVIKILHDDIHRKLLILVAMVLEVPEEVILDMHRPGGSTTNYYRYMSYFPRAQADREKARNLYLPGHADWSTFSILFSQPISALQILEKNNTWKWVRYHPHTLVVNVGEALELLTGTLFKATIHRVVTPPADQADKVRIGILFFTRPNDEKVLEPVAASPYLRKLGLHVSKERVVYPTLQFLEAKKHGYRNKDVDWDRPREEGRHVDPFMFDGKV
ncbi:hypothetical protein BJY04DRAFT_225271 [Aspergillus karnatakaensis]|uniref:uncharacterized protein n=1 Tax=Aspergillus karnatakaensis TaxID=1810916 RepID=UPI003CCD1FC9